MAEVILIDENWVTAYTPLTGAVDPELMKVAAVLAQDQQIASAIGDNLLRKIKTDVAASTISGAYLTLLNDYLRKALTWHTATYLLEMLYVRWDNGAPQIHSSDTAQAITRDDLAVQKDLARDSAQTYTKKMVDYIRANPSDFPEFYNNVSPDRPPQAGMVFNEAGMAISSGRNDRTLPFWTYSQ